MYKFSLIGLLFMPIFMQLSCTPEQSEFIIESDYLLVKTEPIPAGQNPLLTYFWIENNIKSSIESDLAARNMTLDDVAQIHTAQAVLSVRNLDGDLGVLGEVIMRVSDANNPDFKLEGAYTLQIDQRIHHELELIPSLTDLKDVLLGDRFNIELQMRFRDVNVTPLNVELFFKFGMVE